MPDHVHMLVSIPPKICVSSFMGYLKGKSSLMIFDRQPISNINLATESFGRKGSMSQQLDSMKPQFKSISENKKSGI